MTLRGAYQAETHHPSKYEARHPSRKVTWVGSKSSRASVFEHACRELQDTLGGNLTFEHNGEFFLAMLTGLMAYPERITAEDPMRQPVPMTVILEAGGRHPADILDYTIALDLGAEDRTFAAPLARAGNLSASVMWALTHYLNVEQVIEVDE